MDYEQAVMKCFPIHVSGVENLVAQIADAPRRRPYLGIFQALYSKNERSVGTVACPVRRFAPC